MTYPWTVFIKTQVLIYFLMIEENRYQLQLIEASVLSSTQVVELVFEKVVSIMNLTDN